ncbi:MAG: GUN4 domain-containing protein [Microcystaceae cyanobacterium]
MADDLQTPDINQQLSEILAQLSDLSKRVTSVEDKLLLVPDINRYGALQQALVAGNFKQADLETTNVILEAASKTRDTLTPDDMRGIPCGVLRVVDTLWQKYSDKRFGFNIQLEIYKSVGGSLDTLRTQDKAIIRKFADQVGWLKDGQYAGDTYDQWDFSLKAPKGSFPAIWWKSPYGLKMVTFCFIRLFECNT